MIRAQRTRAVAATAMTVLLVLLATARAQQSQPRPARFSEQDANRPTAPAGKDANANTSHDKNLAPLAIKLPQPVPGPTPRQLPPGVRVKIARDKWRPRKPFLAPKGCVNVARGKHVTSSDSEPVVGELSQVTDGDKNGGDGSFVELGPGVQWVQIDLGKPLPIYAIVLWHEHQLPVVYYDVVIQVADDKDFIENVRTIFNNDDDNSAGLGLGEDSGYYEMYEGELIPVKAVKARYVRLYSNGNTGTDLNRYTEVEVYGLPNGKAPATPAETSKTSLKPTPTTKPAGK